MNPKQKEYFWLFVIITFYIVTGYWGFYNISQALFWPIFAIPMSLFLIRTGQKEIVALVGVILSVIISFVNTSTFYPMMVAVFLLFVVAPALTFGILYQRKITIPWIIMLTTVVYFFSWIVFLTFAKLLGVDYLEIYFMALDTSQSIWNHYLADTEVQKMFQGEQGATVLKIYEEAIAQAVLIAKRTYPATLFAISLFTSTLHLLFIQLIARIRSWSRPAMRDILGVGLSPIASLVFIGLWMTAAQVGGVDTIWTFAAESMLNVLFILFKIVGLIAVIVMIMKMGTTKIVRIALSVISMLWLMFNPTILIIIGCLDSIFNFRKAKTLI